MPEDDFFFFQMDILWTVSIWKPFHVGMRQDLVGFTCGKQGKTASFLLIHPVQQDCARQDSASICVYLQERLPDEQIA